MRSDLPAAIPLFFLIAGLAAGPLLVDPALAIAGGLTSAAALVFIRRPAPAIALTFFAAGIALSTSELSRQRQETAAFAEMDPDRFAVIEAPIEGGWSERDGVFTIRCRRFTAEGSSFRQPITIYARFEPPPLGTAATVRIEGTLRRTERGFSATAKSPRLLQYAGEVPWWHPAAWNRRLDQRLARHADRHPEEVALAEALVLGRGERLSDELRESFRSGGTYHLLVFSGLQIALAAAALAALLRWLHAPRAADWLLLLFAGLAPPFIGPTASVSRASIAIALYAISRILRRPTSVPNLWCVAALVRLVMAPGDLTDPSFHLTYAGAGALLFLGRSARSKERPNRLLSGLRFAAGVEIAIAPLTLFHFHQVTLGGSLITLLISPIIFAMLIVSIAACAVPADVVFDTIGLLNHLCGALNAAGLSTFYAAPPLAAMLAGGLGALAALAFVPARNRAAAISIALLIPSAAALTRSHLAARANGTGVTFFDVGQGDAMVVHTGSGTVLVDGGPQQRILPLLADRGIRRVDLALLTHAHPDHCEGLVALVNERGAREVRVSPFRFRGACAGDLLEACMRTRTPVTLLRDGQRFRVGRAAFEVALAGIHFRRAMENNASAVVRAEIGGRRFLLTGDIEQEAELALADRDLRADVLKIAHHGSRSSTSEAMLEAVKPRVAVISCGRANPFGHPHPTVLSRLRDAGIRPWRTDRSGTIDADVIDGKLYIAPSFD